MEHFTPIWPDLLLQIIVAWGCLVVFAPSSKPEDAPSLGKTIGCATFTSLCMVVLSLAVEHYVSPFVFQTSLVIQWVFFTLLGHRTCAIPLGKSMLAQFCFFSLMLGSGLLLEHLRPIEQEAGMTSTNRNGQETVADQLQAALLTHRLTDIRRELRQALYGETDHQEPSVQPPAETLSPFVENNPLPQPTPTIEKEVVEDLSPEPTPLPDASDPEEESDPGAATEQSDDPTLPPPETPTPLPENTPSPPAERLPETALPASPFTEPRVLQGDAELGASRVEKMANVRNRSTDKRYDPPDYVITAITIGQRGGYVMVEGRLVGEGAILTTGGANPRGWKLLRVTEKELFWQPLK